jgi:hypothetical protein
VTAKTNAAHLKFSQVSARPAAQAAAVAYANLELQLLAHLGELRSSRHRLVISPRNLYSGGLHASLEAFSVKVEPAPVFILAGSK